MRRNRTVSIYAGSEEEYMNVRNYNLAFKKDRFRNQ